MKKLIITNLIIFGVMLVIAIFTYANTMYSDLKDLLDILKNSSAMIFTIIGIWLAFLYPSAITAIVNPDSISVIAGEKDAKRIEMLVGIILTSAFVIAGIIVFFALKALISPTVIYINNYSWIKPIGLAFVYHLTCVQILSLAKVVWSNILFINDLHKPINQNKLEKEE